MMDVPFGQLALERGWITQDQLDAALQRQQEIASSEPNRFRRVGHLLIKQGALTPEQVTELLAAQGIAIYRSVGSGRQYNVHHAEPNQTYLSPEDSTSMERVSAEQVRKVIVVDDINRTANSKAPVERMVAPPGALQAEAAQQRQVAPKRTPAEPEPASAGRKRKPTTEEILANSADAPPRAKHPEPDAEPPPVPEPESFVEPPPPVAALNELDEDLDIRSGAAGNHDSEQKGQLGLDFVVDSVPAPAEPPALFGASDGEAQAPEFSSDPPRRVDVPEEDEDDDINIFAPRAKGQPGPFQATDRSDVDLDLAALTPKGSGRKFQQQSPGEELFPPAEANDEPLEEMPPPPVVEDPPAPHVPDSVPLDGVADAGVGMDVGFAAGTGEPPTLHSEEVIYSGRPESSEDVNVPAPASLTPIWEQVGGDAPHDVAAPPPAKEPSPFEADLDLDAPAALTDVAAGAAHAPAGDEDGDSGFGTLQVESLADGDLRAPALDELQAPAEQVEYDATVPEPDAFPDLAPGSASLDYAVDDTPEPAGPTLGESLIDGGLTRPEGGFGFSDGGTDAHAPAHDDPPAIPVRPLDDSQDDNPAQSPAKDGSSEAPLPVDSDEVRRITGSFDRSSIDVTPLDELDDLDDDSL